MKHIFIEFEADGFLLSMPKCHSILSGLHCVSAFLYIVFLLHRVCLFFLWLLLEFVFSNLTLICRGLVQCSHHCPATAFPDDGKPGPFLQDSSGTVLCSCDLGTLVQLGYFQFQSFLGHYCSGFVLLLLAWEKREGQKYWHWFKSILPINHNMSYNSSFIASKKL